jgi:hypothetical protein
MKIIKGMGTILNTFSQNIDNIRDLVNELPRSDKGYMEKEQVELTKLYNKSFELLGRIEKFNKDVKKWCG